MNESNVKTGVERIEPYSLFHFVFEPVGQGMFYTGYIGCNKPFNFVYDCGTSSMNKSERKKGVDEYLSGYIGNRNLDMLVISHFDNDHINGIPELLKNRIAEKVFIPYYNHNDYLMLVAWLYGFSLEEKVGSIIFVPGTVGSENAPTEEINENSFENLDDFSTEYDGGGDFGGNRILSDAIIKDGRISKKFRMMRSKKSKFYIKTSSPVIWEFKFFNNPISNEDLQMVNQEIEKLKKITHCKTLEELIKKLNEKIEITSEDMIGIRQKFRKIYNEISSLKKRERINQTSLCLYHGPIMLYRYQKKEISIFKPEKNNEKNKCVRFRYHLWTDWHKRQMAVVCSSSCKKYNTQCSVSDNHEKLGTLLTGDISLASSYKEFKEFYKDELSKVGFFQIPHHGASTSWSAAFMNEFCFRYYIVSYGEKNKYGHPCPELCHCLGKGDRSLIFVNENEAFLYRMLIPFIVKKK